MVQASGTFLQHSRLFPEPLPTTLSTTLSHARSFSDRPISYLRNGAPKQPHGNLCFQTVACTRLAFLLLAHVFISVIGKLCGSNGITDGRVAWLLLSRLGTLVSGKASEADRNRVVLRESDSTPGMSLCKPSGFQEDSNRGEQKMVWTAVEQK